MVQFPLALYLGRRNRCRDQGVKRRRWEARDDLREPLNQPSVAVPGQARIAGFADERLDRLGVQTHVEHRLHHARHGDGRAGAHRNQQRSPRAAECVTRGAFQQPDALGERLGQLRCRVGSPAPRRRQHEGRRNRQPGPRHSHEVPGLVANLLCAPGGERRSRQDRVELGHPDVCPSVSHRRHAPAPAL